ncbi:hypothetical protein F7Q99_38100 [Streptomyces kaniharaensis]|uniref:Uncharacterized protein n=1 Tax=Streptomyces kaniharaensis TaxID=212423 RepID=A0A6N7L2M0_9ACTN|nr:hypothetical protein [Streptomyces kaniharaensis]MQS17851.1 hypothetical protein [Streptomyces kaniharaensis]
MTTPSTKRPRRPRRPAAPTVPAPAAPVRAARPSAPARPGGGCCRTWSSEHLTPGGMVVKTTWHEPACRTWCRP